VATRTIAISIALSVSLSDIQRFAEAAAVTQLDNKKGKSASGEGKVGASSGQGHWRPSLRAFVIADEL